MTLAILDWGIGGLGLVRELWARRPGLALLYWSDTGVTPYGELPRRELARRVGAVVEALAERGASRVAIACHSGSTAVRDLRSSIPVVGILEYGVQAALASGARHVGVLAGRRTVRSGVYRRALEAAGLDVAQRVGQPLSALIERGVVEGPELDAALGAILAPLPRRLDALLLACTHYPAIAGAIARHVAYPCLDPVGSLADAVLGAGELEDGPSRFETTGDARAMQRAAAVVWQLRLDARAVEPRLGGHHPPGRRRGDGRLPTARTATSTAHPKRT